MFSASALNYGSLILRQRQLVKNFCHFRGINIQNQHSLLRTTTKIQPLNNAGLQIFRMKYNSSDKNNINLSKLRAAKTIWKNIFGKYLLITNIVGSGVLMVFGDLMAQEIEFRRGVSNTQRYDWERTGRMFIVGALQGPLHHYVYNWMDKIMPVANFKNIMKKILIDELLMSPACIFIFFYSACFLENKTLKETNDELKEKFIFIYLIDWLLWPGAQYINFRYLETKYRVTFVNVCTALYNIFMSYVKHDYNLQL